MTDEHWAELFERLGRIEKLVLFSTAVGEVGRRELESWGLKEYIEEAEYLRNVFEEFVTL